MIRYGANIRGAQHDKMHLSNVRFYLQQNDYGSALQCAWQLSLPQDQEKWRQEIFDTISGEIERLWGGLEGDSDKEIAGILREKFAGATSKDIMCIQAALNERRWYPKRPAKARAKSLKKIFERIEKRNEKDDFEYAPEDVTHEEESETE